MEQNQEKKPVKGQEFLRKVGKNLMGEQDPNPSPEDTAKEYESKTKSVEAQDRYLTTVDKIKNPPSVVEMQKEQAQRLADEKKAEKDRADAAEQRERDRINKESEDAKTKAAESERKRIEAEQNLQAQQNQILLDKLEELRTSQKPLSQQFEEYFSFADKVAEKMGYQKPGATKPASENPQIALEIAKLDLESAREERRFQLEMDDRKRAWDLKLLELGDNREFKKKQLEMDEKKNEQLFSFPQIIGGAIAKGLIDHEAGVSQESISQRQQNTKSFQFQVPEGGFGTTECPGCHAPIEIGPTTDLAECVECHAQYPVIRTPMKGPETPQAVKEEE